MSKIIVPAPLKVNTKKRKLESPTSEDESPVKKTALEPIPSELQLFLECNKIPVSVRDQFRQEYHRMPKQHIHQLIGVFEASSIQTLLMAKYFNLAELCELIVYCLFEHAMDLLVMLYDKQEQQPKYFIISSWQELDKLLSILSPFMDSNIKSEDLDFQFEGIIGVPPVPLETVSHSFQNTVPIYRIHDKVITKITEQLSTHFSYCTDRGDALWLRALKNCQWWMWWGPRFPTEFVFLITKLLGQSNSHMMLNLLFNYSNWSRKEASLEVIDCPFQMILGLDDVPLHSLTYFDVSTHLPFVPTDGSTGYNNTFTRANLPIYILRKSLSHGHIQVSKKPNQSVEACLETTAQEFMTSLACPSKLLSWKIPIPLAVLTLISHTGNELLPMWHNVLHNYITKLLGYAHVEARNTDISNAASQWYQNLTGHQSIFQSFLGLPIQKASALIESSYKLGIKFACGFIDHFDWLVSLVQFLDGQSQATQFSLLAPLLEKSPEPRDIYSRFMLVNEQCKQSLFQPQILGRILLSAFQRYIFGNSLIASDEIDYWKLVFHKQEQRLALYSSDTQWWSAPLLFKSLSVQGLEDTFPNQEDTKLTFISNRAPLNTTLHISSCNGYTWRPSRWNQYQVKEREENETVYLTSNELDAVKTTELHNHYDKCEQAMEKVDLSWLKALLVALLTNLQTTRLDINKRPLTLHQAFQRNLISLPRLLTQVRVDMLGYSGASKDLLEYTLLLANPETVSPLIIQYLVKRLCDSYFEMGTLETLTSTWAPYIPASSLVLDTLTFLKQQKRFKSDISQTETNHYNLLLAMATSHYVVLRLQRIYGITFSVQIIYQSSPFGYTVGQHLSHTEFITFLQNAIFAMQSYSLQW